MAKMKHLRKSAAKFRKSEPYLHSLCTKALYFMANQIRKTQAVEMTVTINNNGIITDWNADQ